MPAPEKIALVHDGVTNPFMVSPDAYYGWAALGWQLANPSDSQWLPVAPVPSVVDVVTRDELDAQVVALTAAPAYAGPRTRPYIRELGLYGADTATLQPLRAALGHALSGAALVPLMCIGDSETAGWKANPGINDPVTVLRNLLRGVGHPVTGGWIFPANGTPTPTSDARLTFSGTWSGRTGTTSNYVWSTGTAGAYVEWAPDLPGTVVEAAVFSTATQDMTYSIDGGAPVTFNVVAGAIRKIQVTGLTSALHTIRLTRSASSGTLWLGPARVRATAGLSVSNPGIFGSFANDWLPTAMASAYYNPYNLTLALETPKIAVVALGANEALNAGTPAQLVTRLTTIVAGLQSAGVTVVLKTYMPPADSTINAANAPAVWTDYVKAIYDVADARGCALIDHTDGFQDTNVLKTQGLMHTDNIHPLGPGYAVVAKRDFNALMSL